MIDREQNDFKEGLDNESKPTGFKRMFLIFGLLTVLIISGAYIVNGISKPPSDFPTNTPVIIPEGTTLREAVALMKESGYVKSELALFLYFTIYHDSESIKASTYVFEEPLNLKELTSRLTKGNYTEGLIKLTHIEGERTELLAERATKTLLDFDKEKFILLAKDYEGRLLPETYLIPDDYTEEELFNLLTSTFEEKVTPLQEKIDQHELSLEEVIILASILEREANTPESKKIVSGILQNRLAINMALQVDASVEYILDKPLSELVPEDLKIDSPYNTYLNTGLPPTAIGNPGLEAIEAVLSPTPSDYMFYITGNDGEFYYAKTFDGHKQNVARYLR